MNGWTDGRTGQWTNKQTNVLSYINTKFNYLFAGHSCKVSIKSEYIHTKLAVTPGKHKRFVNYLLRMKDTYGVNKSEYLSTTKYYPISIPQIMRLRIWWLVLLLTSWGVHGSSVTDHQTVLWAASSQSKKRVLDLDHRLQQILLELVHWNTQNNN